jgi:hypothetical protein
MEESKVTDPATGKRIRVSVTARKLYRLSEEYQGIRNARLNEIIATHFAKDSDKIIHYFPLTKKGPKAVGEIRGYSAGGYYISAIRDGYIDILTVQNDYVKHNYMVKDPGRIKLKD